MRYKASPSPWCILWKRSRKGSFSSLLGPSWSNWFGSAQWNIWNHNIQTSVIKQLKHKHQTIVVIDIYIYIVYDSRQDDRYWHLSRNNCCSSSSPSSGRLLWPCYNLLHSLSFQQHNPRWFISGFGLIVVSGWCLHYQLPDQIHWAFTEEVCFYLNGSPQNLFCFEMIWRQLFNIECSFCITLLIINGSFDRDRYTVRRQWG